MTDRIACGGLQVASELYRFINDEAIPGTGLEADQFWAGVDQLVHELAPINRELVAKRDVLQEKIDAYHKARQGQPHDAAEYKAFLEDIGYLLPEPQNVSIQQRTLIPKLPPQQGPNWSFPS